MEKSKKKTIKKDKTITKKELEKKVKKISEEKKNLEKEKNKYFEIAKRYAAEADNTKKQYKKIYDLEKEKNEEKWILSIISIVDDIERSVASKEEEKKGMKILKEKIDKILEENNIKKIKNDTTFSEKYHEALFQIPTKDKSKENMILSIIENGYIKDEKVIRPVKVGIGKYEKE